jgi:Cu2+-exporting ATPase
MEKGEAPAVYQAADHVAHEHTGHDPDVFRRRFWVSLFLTIPILIWASPLPEWLGWSPPSWPGVRWIGLVLSSVVFAYGGRVFLVGAWDELRTRTPGMMTLISLAISVAYGYSLATEIGLSGMPLYWELATLIDAMLLGHWIELRAVQRSRGALDELAKLLPDTAERVIGDQIERVPVAALRPGDLVLIRPGAQLPADGEIVTGESTLNEAMMTGESQPVSKQPGDEVLGGTVNGQGALRVRVSRVGQETALGGIMRIVAEAQASKSRAQALADRAAYWLTLIAITAGSLTFLAWLFTDEPLSFAIERAVTVLVIACPHALGVAIPLVVAISTTLSARNGLLVRNRLALEESRDLNTVVFDKTGTLTRGELGVVNLATANGVALEDLLIKAVSVEADAEHPIGQAIVAYARQNGVSPQPVAQFEALAGRGAQALVNGNRVAVGGPRLLEQLGITLPLALEEESRRWGASGHSVVTVVVDQQVGGILAVADVVRPESRAAVQALQDGGVQVAMITGDSQAVAESVARELGIDEVFAQVLPEHKSDRVKDLRRRGRRVAMVGDGVNDAPALVTADVGIAVGAGTDVAIESADIILVRDDPRDVPKVIALSRASYRKMLQNLAWATGYNVVAIPLAAGVLASWGIILAPALGALFMSASTVIVAINAQLLRRVDLTVAPR